MAAQRFSDSVSPDTGWANPISPYTPLLPVPAATPTAIAIAAGDGATIAWREGAKVKVQRYPSGGGVVWVRPPAATMSGHVELATDGNGGAFLAGPSGAGITACHVVSSGAVSTHTLASLGLGDPRVGALVTNRAGDLFIGYGDARRVRRFGRRAPHLDGRPQHHRPGQHAAGHLRLGRRGRRRRRLPGRRHHGLRAATCGTWAPAPGSS